MIRKSVVVKADFGIEHSGTVIKELKFPPVVL